MPLSINDGKGTPQAHVFTQDAQQNGADPAEFVNRGNANGPSFWERLTSLVTLGKKASVPHVIKTTLTRPIAGTVNGNPAVLGFHKLHQTLLIDQAVATEADVLDSLVMMANLGDNATFRAQVKQFAPILIP
jgi:hypothetical protein